MSDQLPQNDPQAALLEIRRLLKDASAEYSAGKLNAVQFNALYRHYMEKREIIEKLIEIDPQSDAWKAAASSGATSYIKDRFEARPLYYVVFRKGDRKPLINNGKVPQKAAEQIFKILQVFWKMETWKTGLARKSVGDGMWMMLMVGKQSLTIAIYFLQPSTLQQNRLRDLHSDFERANAQALERGYSPNRMVFPQRAILDQKTGG